MAKIISPDDFNALDKSLDGFVHYDHLSQIIYATDASVYRELPTAVVFPKNSSDIKKIIAFANKHQSSIIPRAGGTSLAGQCVGDGIVVDVSRYMTDILELDIEKQTVKVQPGIIRDQLNNKLVEHGLFFSPITSTANRATIGGMVGNNSSGTSSIKYGVTRDKLISLKGILADGSEVKFEKLDNSTWAEKSSLSDMEGEIYSYFSEILKNKQTQQLIKSNFPKTSIHRRNTGYALDSVIDFTKLEEDCFINLAKLICGSEGTLMFITEIEIKLDPLPPKEVAVIAAHYNSIQDSLIATQFAMNHTPYACELMDKVILDCTKGNKEQAKNRFFVVGDPQAILMIELRADSKIKLKEKLDNCLKDLHNKTSVLAVPIIEGEESKKVWTLRAAGLGLLANIPGDKKAVACIEDTAVSLEDLPNYIKEFTELMVRFKQKAVYYAHAGAGELHLRPILDLNLEPDKEDFYNITKDLSQLVKKYNGSLSGEHGDGRVRAPFIKDMVGDELYNIFKKIKAIFDPENIFNPGKIVHPKPMTSDLRQDIHHNREIKTSFSFRKEGGILRAAEKCNGSGDCRKLPESGGTMCPSYHATKNEKDTTRARANMLREILSTNKNENAFDSEELKKVMDLCISCKACASECPSNVDMASLKAEFLHQYYKTNGINLRARAFANISEINKLTSTIPSIYNFLARAKISGSLVKSMLHIAPQRSLPPLSKITLRKWYRKNYNAPKNPIKSVYLFCDAFTNYQESHIGIAAIQLLTKTGYDVKIIDHPESGRAAISKGLLAKAKKYANENISIFSRLIDKNTPLIGIEPSAILSFIDEYPRLVNDELKQQSEILASQVFLIEDFIFQEAQKGNISSKNFTKESKNILFHGHCHQKSLANVENSIWMLSLPANYSVQFIQAGCCGMAGSFGYEKEHFDVSQKIAEITLIPEIKKSSTDTIISANGTSCRHQIYDFAQRNSFHPIEILNNAIS